MVEDDQPPIASTKMLYNRVGTSSEPIWPGSNESKLSMVFELIHLKAQYQVPNTCYDDLCRIMQRLMPEDNVMSKNIYETKNLVHDMGSSNREAYKKMYYFTLTHRLQRLYASKVTAKHMRWHAEHQTDEVDLMCHPSDSLAWITLSRV
ncbi:hypothetical protein V6N12_058730 [Hibiscus sabdariffa]|uniref:Uncharacterized protein n=1 Tax=Hibiscus sabdariffa TaxID=183260 RepID=A0ABR2EX15_9ROSI